LIPPTLRDLDGDSYPDLLMSSYDSGAVSDTRFRLYVGLGNGEFAPPIDAGFLEGQPQNRGSLGDLDGDGCVDWLGGPDDDGLRGAILARRGDCMGGFGPGYELVNLWSLPGNAVGTIPKLSTSGRGTSNLIDHDGDGDLDLLSFHQTGIMLTEASIWLWSNDGVGEFSDPILLTDQQQPFHGMLASPETPPSMLSGCERDMNDHGCSGEHALLPLLLPFSVFACRRRFD